MHVTKKVVEKFCCLQNRPYLCTRERTAGVTLQEKLISHE